MVLKIYKYKACKNPHIGCVQKWDHFIPYFYLLSLFDLLIQKKNDWI